MESGSEITEVQLALHDLRAVFIYQLLRVWLPFSDLESLGSELIRAERVSVEVQRFYDVARPFIHLERNADVSRIILHLRCDFYGAEARCAIHSFQILYAAANEFVAVLSVGEESPP